MALSKRGAVSCVSADDAAAEWVWARIPAANAKRIFVGWLDEWSSGMPSARQFNVGEDEWLKKQINEAQKILAGRTTTLISAREYV
jgi:hypothetical protein